MSQEPQVDDLIERARRLETEAFDELVERFSLRVYGFLYRLTGSRSAAEDLVQEVFVRVVRSIGTYDHTGRFESWLFRIAGNLARDHVRRVSRAPVLVPLDRVTDGPATAPSGGARLPFSAEPAPDAALRLEEQRDLLQNCLLRLPDAEREVVLLRHYAGMTFVEIATLMDSPLGTALARAHRALEKLRKWMEAES